MTTRRQFVTGLITGAAALALCPQELLPAPRSYFFAPPGGWLDPAVGWHGDWTIFDDIEGGLVVEDGDRVMRTWVKISGTAIDQHGEHPFSELLWIPADA